MLLRAVSPVARVPLILSALSVGLNCLREKPRRREFHRPYGARVLFLSSSPGDTVDP